MPIKKTFLIAASTITLLSGIAIVSSSIAQNAPSVPSATKAEPVKSEDTKKDGYGYGKEYKGGVPDYIKELDKNADGMITKEEYEAGFAERLKKADTSGKGQLSRADTEKMVREQLEKQVQRMTDGIMRMTDSNADGTISKEEWVASHQKRFETMDKNKDGKIDEKEMKRGKRGPKHGEGHEARAHGDKK